MNGRKRTETVPWRLLSVVCAQLLGKSPMAMSQSEFYAFVAREADMNTLTRQCSKGFAPFAQRVRSL
jgi:hypothetical protein